MKKLAISHIFITMAVFSCRPTATQDVNILNSNTEASKPKLASYSSLSDIKIMTVDYPFISCILEKGATIETFNLLNLETPGKVSIEVERIHSAMALIDENNSSYKDKTASGKLESGGDSDSGTYTNSNRLEEALASIVRQDLTNTSCSLDDVQINKFRNRKISIEASKLAKIENKIEEDKQNDPIDVIRAPLDGTLGLFCGSVGNGWWHAPRNNKTGLHTGIDIGCNTGDPLYAAADGIITHSFYEGRAGNVIELNFKVNGTNYYLNSKHISKRYVKAGQHVKKGERIGTCGSSGNAAEPHIHFEVFTSASGGRVNPMDFFKQVGINITKGSCSRL